MNTNVKEKTLVTVYESISNNRFEPTRSLRPWGYADKKDECEKSIKQSIETWKKRYQDCKNENNEEGMAFAAAYVEQYTKEFLTVRVIDIEGFEKEQAKLLLTGPQEITEDIYWEMLECLPPLKMGKNYFIMSEFFTDSYTRQFFKKNKKYYTQMIDYKNQDTWAVL